MSRGFSAIALILLVPLTIAGFVLGVTISRNKINPANTATIKTNSSTSNTSKTDSLRPEFIPIPVEYQIFQDYLEVIKAISTTPTEEINITGQIISVNKEEICPDKRLPSDPENTNCSVPPYPKDTALIKIEKIEKVLLPLASADKPSTSKNTGDAVTVIDQSEAAPPKTYNPLSIGQEVSALLILTSSPVKVKYASSPETESAPVETISKNSLRAPKNAEIQAAPGGAEVGGGRAVDIPKKTYKPLPKEGNYFVFTTKMGPYPDGTEKMLSGLKAGDRFTAQILYNGTIFIEEYTRF